MMTPRASVFIVGGGPAGLAASVELRRRGFAVRVADGAVPPIDKACGEGLMPDTVAALHRMGVPIEPANGYPLRGIRFVSNGVSVTANFSSGQGIGVRRTVLHAKMATYAEKIGVEIFWNSPVTGISTDGVHTRGNVFAADWIVGADGSGSRVRRWSGLEKSTSQTRRFAFRSHFELAPWSEYVEIHWADDAQAYVTPVGERQVCIVVLSEKPAMRADIIGSKFPALAAQLRNANPSGVERGAVTTTRRLKQIYKNNVALVGDASGAVDAITGEGLNLSFQHAIALADTLPSGDLSAYQKIHRQMQRRPSKTGYLLSVLGRQRFMRERTISAFLAEPSLFDRFLDLHLGHATLSQAASAAMQLGWRFATC
jgi:2-polyprenyl-6-methoxyphenol hydroxylase-like FAD-dependent oxidoreductase